MSRSPLVDAFGHHVWATLRVIDACLSLSPEQLETAAPGTFGSMLDTMRHLVGADSSYLSVTGGGRNLPIDDEAMDLTELRAAMESQGAGWATLVREDLDPDIVLTRHRGDGSSTQAPLGIRLAQVLHHGSDHRSQICTALTSLGIEPPEIDVWDFGTQAGCVVETPPSS